MLYSRFGMLRDLERESNTLMLKVNCNKNFAALTGKHFHGAAGDTQISRRAAQASFAHYYSGLKKWDQA